MTSSERTNISYAQVQTFTSTCSKRLRFRRFCLLLRMRLQCLHFGPPTPPPSSPMMRISKTPVQTPITEPHGRSRKLAYGYAQQVIAFYRVRRYQNSTRPLPHQRYGFAPNKDSPVGGEGGIRPLIAICTVYKGSRRNLPGVYTAHVISV